MGKFENEVDMLTKFFEERLSVKESSFEESGRSAEGAINPQYFVQRLSDNQPHVIKSVLAKPEDRALIGSGRERKRVSFMMQFSSFVTEYVTSEIYRVGVLYDQVSNVELVEHEPELNRVKFSKKKKGKVTPVEGKQVLMRSSFLNEFFYIARCS